MAAASKMMSIASLTHFRPLTTAAATTTSPSRLVQHPPDLIKWVRREGGFVHQAVKIAKVDPYGLGLVVSDYVPVGSDLIALPRHLPLRFSENEHVVGVGGDGFESVLADLARRIPEELWAMKLGLRLLRERAIVGSFWWPYISNLPETYNVPIFFPGDDIKNLQYAPLLHQVNKRCRYLLEFSNEVKVALENVIDDHHPFGGQDVDASSLGWAMSAVSSRAFRLHGKKLPNGAHSDIPMMLPLIDMCNHSFSANARIVQEPDSKNSNTLVKVVAERPIKQDDSLSLNYGCLNNDMFLLDYGFVVPCNPYDCIELRYDGALLDAASMASGASSPHFSSPSPWQLQILEELGFVGKNPDLRVRLGGADLVEGRFLAALRVLLAAELAALRTVVALCVIALEHFPTKVMDDESVLKNGVSPSTELAIKFRIQKKSVIIDTMRDLARRAKLLAAKEKTQS